MTWILHLELVYHFARQKKKNESKRDPILNSLNLCPKALPQQGGRSAHERIPVFPNFRGYEHRRATNCPRPK